MALKDFFFMFLLMALQSFHQIGFVDMGHPVAGPSNIVQEDHREVLYPTTSGCRRKFPQHFRDFLPSLSTSIPHIPKPIPQHPLPVPPRAPEPITEPISQQSPELEP